jgi:hypothetical protein
MTQGFRNAPSITEFAVGMDFVFNGDKYHVVHVDYNGCYCIRFGDGVTGLSTHCVSGCTLDLNSIWIGRKYQRKTLADNVATVLMVNDEYVAFTNGVVKCCWERHGFLSAWEPQPLPTTPHTCGECAEVACASVAKEAWKPKSGEKCQRELSGKGLQDVIVIATNGSQSWIVPEWKSEDSEYRGFIVCNRELRPIPSKPPDRAEPSKSMKGGSVLVHRLSTGPVQAYSVESIELGAANEIGVVRLRSLTQRNSQNGEPVECSVPSNMVYALVEQGIVEVHQGGYWSSEPQVKEGDYVEVRWKELNTFVAFGRVSEIDTFGVALDGISGTFAMGDIVLTRLVPDTLCAKMRKRLGELRDKADTSRASIASAYMTELLSDLEAYAKESQ